jgi:hypothetical protein
VRVVIPSVHCADFLFATLPAWRALLPKALFTVVTSPDDKLTPGIATTLGAGVHVTDAWTRDGATFNKGRALDEAFGFVGSSPPDENERCLSLDADVFPFGRFPSAKQTSADTLYGCARYECQTQRELFDHCAGVTARDSMRLIYPRKKGESSPETAADASADVPNAARQALGYFQLFLYRRGLKFGDSKTAGKYDIAVRQNVTHRRGLTDFYVLHLGEMNRANWRGRVVGPWPPKELAS